MKHTIRWLRDHPRAADAMLAGAILLLGIIAHFTARYTDGTDNVADPSVLGVFLVAASTVPLAWRRRNPLAVLVVVTLAQWGLELIDGAGSGWMGPPPGPAPVVGRGSLPRCCRHVRDSRRAQR